MHLWKLTDECIHAVVGAVPSIRLVDGVLTTEIREMEYERIDGPMLVEAFAWTRSLGGRAMSLPARTVDTARFEIGGATYALTPTHAEVTPSGILVSARLRADE